MAGLTELLSNMEPTGESLEPIYCRDSDAVHFFWSDVDYFAERVDDLLTVYRAVEDERLIGLKIKGVARILERFNSLGLGLLDGQVSVEALLLCETADGEEKIGRRETYRLVRQQLNERPARIVVDAK